MITRYVTIEEAEQITRDHEKALRLLERLNKIVDERGYIVFSDLKYYYPFE